VSDCLFCGIVAGDIPSERVSESERVLAFRDIAPAAPTHVIVVPKAHFADLNELVAADAELLADVVREAAAVAAGEGVGSGYRLVFNNGAEAGQSVFHVHRNQTRHKRGSSCPVRIRW
jgi:histidine triad (HIT) family protein